MLAGAQLVTFVVGRYFISDAIFGARANMRLKTSNQKDAATSSWTFGEAMSIRIWELLWFVFLRWTPKKVNSLRIFALRLFGATVYGRPFVFSSARIYAPFNLEIYDGVCIGPRTNIYNLGRLVLRERCVVSQEAMLCGGTHDLSSRRLPLLVGDTEVGQDVFVGARALILPGVNLGEGSVVGAGAVVTKDVEPWTVVGGNPAKFIKKRELKENK